MMKDPRNMTHEELEEYMREQLITKYSQGGTRTRFRVVFAVGGVEVFTAPMSVEELVRVYHGYPSNNRYTKFVEAMDMVVSINDYKYPLVQFEHIEGKVWRTHGEYYREG